MTTSPATLSLLSLEAADAAIQSSRFADQIEDYEFDDATNRHLYFLPNGSVIAPTNRNGRIIIARIED